MDTPSSSNSALRALRPGTLLFQGPEYRYEFLRRLLNHADYSPLVLARRKPLKGSGSAHTVLLRHVVMPPRPERRQRALEEVRLAEHLRHPHIARVHGLEEYQGRPFLVTEFMPGCFLDTAESTSLERQGHPLSPAFACYIAAAVADALHYAWSLQGEHGQPLHIVHRAVSPMAIRLGRKGQVQLTDFGVAWSRMTGRIHTAPWMLRADVAYAAPEVVRFQPPDGRADLFSLGLALLEMLSGQYPLDPTDVALPSEESSEVARYNARVRTEHTSWASVGQLADRLLRFGPEDVERAARGVPEQLKPILHKALRASPEDRYQTGAELRDDLRAYLHLDRRPFGPSEAATELAPLLREKPSPHETHALPSEKGVVPTPEELASRKKKPLH